MFLLGPQLEFMTTSYPILLVLEKVCVGTGRDRGGDELYGRGRGNVLAK